MIIFRVLVVVLTCGGSDCLLFNDNLSEARYAKGGNRLDILEDWEDDEAFEA